MPKPRRVEFRQRAVELARMREKPIAEIAADLGISDSCLRNWMRHADPSPFALRRPASADRVGPSQF